MIESVIISVMQQLNWCLREDKMIKLYDDIVAVQRFTDVAVCSFVRLPVRSFGQDKRYRSFNTKNIE